MPSTCRHSSKPGCPLAAIENRLRQREAAPILENWQQLVQLRPGVAARESDANRMKELFALLPGLRFNDGDDFLPIARNLAAGLCKLCCQHPNHVRSLALR